MRQIKIKVDAPGVKAALDSISNSMAGVNKNTKSLADGFRRLQGVFGGYLAGLGIREIASLADQMTNLNSRLKIVSKAGEDTNDVFQKLVGLSNDTRSSIADTAEIYTRIASSLKAAGASSDTLVDITKTLIQSFKVSGATGTETTATVIQLSQAFSRGTLRGQELNSVLSQNATLAAALREKYGKDLFKKAEEGAISVVEVLKILKEQQNTINEQAKNIAPTFESSVTKAFNAATVAIHNFNTELKLSEKFAATVDFIIAKFDLFAAVIGVLALTRIPTLIAAIQRLGVAMVTLATTNPLTAALLGISAIIIATSDSIDDFIDKIRNLGAWIVQLKVWVLEARFAIDKALAKGLNKVGLLAKRDIVALAQDLDQIKALKELAERLGTPTAKKTDPSNLTNKNADKDFKAMLDKLQAITGAGDKAEKIKDILGDINKEFLAGAITIEEYNSKLVNFELYKLNREFKEGKFDIFQYNQRLRELKVQDLNRDVQAMRLSWKDYNAEVSKLKIDELNEKFRTGRVGLVEYHNELTKISNEFLPGSALVSGTSQYLESIGTVSTQVAGMIKSTFSNLEDALVDFVKRGKFNFRDFAQAVLDDLTRIIIRASIIQPIANALVGGFTGTTATTTSGGSYTDTSGFAAKGAMFDGRNAKFFANGGIVNSPTMFKYGGSKTGVMGEAGPEAILPLSRGAGGKLGVQASVTPVTVNIINQAGADVQQTETTGPNGEKTIEVLITQKVRDGLMSGKYDTAMKTAYGLNRKGS